MLTQKTEAISKNEVNAEKRMKKLLENFMRNQEIEFKTLQGKLESGREEILKGREEDYKRILAKYRVLRENLEDSQAMERQKIQKNLKSFRPSSNFFSRSVQERNGGEYEQ